ncbi:hypothetical protein QIH01_01405 [Brevibacillus brevis]|uniref:hypothetical protein n=1 Tax=Brevibacillus brevis TaxID=1393 RepID=UPI0007D8C149|nr:hypothetical protein [Brevibacillus brevis]WGV59817.1 hypothetical protein QIH01_01405 [Brevibacillus brevis]
MIHARYITLFFGVISFFVLIMGCSERTGTPVSETNLKSIFPKEQLKEIWVQLYREDSIKAQPELIAEYFEDPDLNKILNWIHEGVISDFEGTIASLSILQFEYGTKEGAAEAKYIMYAATKEGGYYIKPFNITPHFNLDSYKQEDGDKLISLLGKTEWYKVERAPY